MGRSVQLSSSSDALASFTCPSGYRDVGESLSIG